MPSTPPRSVVFLLLAALACGPRGGTVSAAPQDPRKAGGAAPSEGVARITVLHTNDWHGHVLPRGEGGRRTGGLAAAAAALATARGEAEASGAGVLVLDAGDWFQGTPEGAIEKGAVVVDLLGLLRLDAGALGNHEFDHGRGTAEALVARAPFPVLCANLRDPGTGGTMSGVRAHVLLERAGVRIGVVGLLTERLGVATGALGGLELRPAAGSAREALARARDEGARMTVLLTHLGIEEDRALAAALPEAGLIVGGHSHTPIPEGERPVPGGPWVLQTAGLGTQVGRADLEVERRTGRVRSCRARLVDLDEAATGADAEVARIVAESTSAVAAAMRERLGEAVEGLSRDSRRFAGVSSPLGNWVADVIREATSAEVALVNRTGIRGTLRKGTVTRRTIHEIAPFENTLATLALTGAELRGVLERAVSDPRLWLEVSGIRATYDPRAGVGARVRELAVGGKPLRAEDRVLVGTISFLAGGGDDHRGFLRGRERRDTGVALRDALESWVRGRGRFRHPYENRLVRLDRPDAPEAGGDD